MKKKFRIPDNKTLSLYACFACLALILIALYLEVYYKLQPCPLCILQRVIVLSLGVLFLAAGLLRFTPKTQRYYYLLTCFISLSGAGIAGRQVWLETLPPDQVPSCGAGLAYIFQLMPFTQALKLVLQGTGDCAVVTWRMFGLSMPAWMLGIFILFAIFSLWMAFRNKII